MRASTETSVWQQRWIIFSIAFASFMVNVDTYIVNISLPTIADYFHVGSGEVAWTVLSYQLAVTSLLLVFGRLGDRLGLRRVFCAGFCVFTLSSLLCGLAPSLTWLVVGRFVQGVGASALYALTPAMMTHFLPERRRGPAFGTLATFTALGMTLGAPVGGLITGYLSWHWIFLVNLPIGAAAILACQWLLPKDPPVGAEGGGDFDVVGAGLSLVASAAFVYALSVGGKTGWGSPTIVCALIVSAASFHGFVMWERRARTPLLDLALFRCRQFIYGNLASCIAYAFLAGTNFLMPFYLTRAKDLRPEQAGMMFLIYSLVYMATGPAAGRLSLRVHPNLLCAAGMGAGAAAAFMFAGLLSAPSLVPAVLFLAGQALAYGTFSTCNNSVIMAMAPKNKEGSVSGVFRMIMRFGMVLGVCVFGTIYSLAAPALDGAAAPSHAGLLPGFQYVYLAGGVACLLALCCSLLARRPPRESGSQPQ